MFSEQCNGNNKTDYGSAFANIGLTVTGESHTVTFDTDQQGVTPVAQTVGHGSRAADPGPQATDDMELVGWQYLPEGYEERINFDFDTPITADTTLFAKWEQRPQLIVNASGLNCGSFTITGSDGVVYAQNRSVNTFLPPGITVTLTISPDENCTFSGFYQFHRSTIGTVLSSSLTTYDLSNGNVTVDLAFEKLPVLTMKVTSPEESSGWWAVKDGASTPNSYTNGSPIPISTGEISIAADWLTLTITPPEGIGCDGSIDNNGAITTVADGKTVYSGIDAKGPVNITLNYYARSVFHTIRFYNGNTPISSQQVAVSEEPGQPATAKLNPYTNTSGKFFRGWNTVAAQTAENPGTFYADNAEISLTGDVDLYAQWTDAYAVTFDKNNGEGSMDKFRLPKSDATGNLPACAFTRSGYAFSGWNTNANCLGDSYTDGQQVTLTKSLTLYAQWTTAWTLSFYPNDGEGSMADIVVARGQTAALPACAFTREGYDFAGWAATANGEKIYDDQASVTLTDNCTLYALWIPHVYAISYELDGGALPQGVTNPDNYTIETPTICLHEPVKENFTFDGWYADAGLARSATDIGQGSTGDKTFYAKWSESDPCILPRNLHPARGCNHRRG